MALFKLYLFSLLELILFLIAGFLLTNYILQPIYELSGIRFIGNVGIVWMGVSFILFSIATLLRTRFSKDKGAARILLKDRLGSLTFWAILACSIAVVIIPFISGKMY
ncbi:hypothetical protein GCM10009865_50610 [Aeromicrobium ponti]|uniref:Uncharacterized protein n=1 Tax=Cytobacillus oceanisediminis TaxID=665099 RepID=A0A562J7T3_9BACI|nr:hypothetical protein [Cytobacillus oceanisediminis]TWH79251.1 hypothetical protein IQ19_04998 [Cytobacillus oceanisediminis]